MTYVVGTSGSLVELIRVASATNPLRMSELDREDYSLEDVRDIFRHAKNADKGTSFASPHILYSGAIGEITTINSIRALDLEGVLLNNIHIISPRRTQIDHALVGSYGIIIIDSKRKKSGFNQKDIADVARQLTRAQGIVTNFMNRFVTLPEDAFMKVAVMYGNMEGLTIPSTARYVSNAEEIPPLVRRNVFDKETQQKVQSLLMRRVIILRTPPSDGEKNPPARYMLP